jgi:hypothetical protein
MSAEILINVTSMETRVAFDKRIQGYRDTGIQDKS